jgi:exopolysaccharide biosynthesis protein
MAVQAQRRWQLSEPGVADEIPKHETTTEEHSVKRKVKIHIMFSEMSKRASRSFKFGALSDTKIFRP